LSEKAGLFLGKSRWISIALGTSLLFIVLSVFSPVFLTFSNLLDLLVNSAFVGIMSAGLTLVIMSGNIDISVGAIVYLVGASVTKLTTSLGMPATLSWVLGLLLGVGLGLINGLLVSYIELNPLIVTLATFNVFRGIAIRVGGLQILLVPERLTFFGASSILRVPMPVLLFVLVVALLVALSTRTWFGRQVLAVGCSRESAVATGIPIKWVTVITYVISGFCASLGALVLIGRVGAIQPNLGIGSEFTAISAAVLGGTALSGGIGSVFGSAIGAVFLSLIVNGLNLLEVPIYAYDIVRGVILASAVLVDRLTAARLTRSWMGKIKRVLSLVKEV